MPDPWTARLHGPRRPERSDGQNRSHRQNGAGRQNGANGANGANGIDAYAIVEPTSPSAASLIGASNIIAVSEPSAGVYCITPAPGIASSSIAAVSPEVSYSAPGTGPGVIAVNAQHTHCPSTPYEVDTYAPGTTTDTATATGYAFTIAVP